MRQLRVLYLIDSLGPGGAQRQLVTLLQQLDRSQVLPEVAVYHRLDHFRPELESAGVAVRLLRGRSGRDPIVLFGLSRLIARGGYDIVHSYLRTPGTLARLATAFSRSVRIVVSERNVGLGDSRLRLTLERLLAGRADVMIANAHAISREVERLVPAWTGRVRVVPNGIVWSKPSEDDRARGREFRARHVGDAERLLAVVGRVERQKAPEVLVDALRLVPEGTLASLRVVWVGPRIDAGLAESVESAVAGSKLEGRLEFVGETRDTRSAYLGSDGVVLCSRWEGLPNVVLEALAHGRPVVATDVGDTRLLVEGGHGGWLVPPDDPSALAEAVAEFARTPDDELAAMGRRGSEFVRREYSASKLAERTLEVYKEVMSSRGAQAEPGDDTHDS